MISEEGRKQEEREMRKEEKNVVQKEGERKMELMEEGKKGR